MKTAGNARTHSATSVQSSGTAVVQMGAYALPCLVLLISFGAGTWSCAPPTHKSSAELPNRPELLADIATADSMREIPGDVATTELADDINSPGDARSGPDRCQDILDLDSESSSDLIDVSLDIEIRDLHMDLLADSTHDSIHADAETTDLPPLQDTSSQICEPNSFFLTDDKCARCNEWGTGQLYALKVNDGNECTLDECDPANGPVHSPVDGPCDDGKPETANDKCMDGICKGTITCEPDAVECEGSFNIVQCHSNGIGIELLQDCAEMSAICYEAICLTDICGVGESVCLDPSTLSLCGPDGSPVGVYSCLPFPCVDGKCVESGEWNCEPGQTYCDGFTAHTCNLTGDGPLDGGIDCLAAGTWCAGGICGGCLPACGYRECGDNGCGGTCGDCGEEVCVDAFCAPAGVPCDDVNEDAWDGCTDGVVTEFLVTEPGAYAPTNPTVSTPDSSDVALVAWSHMTGGPEQGGLRGRWLNLDTGGLGDIVKMNSEEALATYAAASTALADASVAVIWMESKAPGESELWGRVVASEGLPPAPPFRISLEGAAKPRSPVVSKTADDGFLVAWYVTWDGDGAGVVARGLDASGTPLADPYSATDVFGYASHPTLAPGPGSVLLAYAGSAVDDDGFQVAMKWLSAEGPAGSGAATVSEPDGQHHLAPVACALDTGAYALAWQTTTNTWEPFEPPAFCGDCQLKARFLGQDGNPSSDQFPLDCGPWETCRGLSIVESEGDEAMIAYQGCKDKIGDGYGMDALFETCEVLLLKVSKAAGQVGDPTQLNIFSFGNQGGVAMASLSPGTIVVWTSYSDLDDGNLLAVILDENSKKANWFPTQ